jgi:hypothetical protein
MHQLGDIELPIEYRSDVLAGLLEFGAAPTPRTQPRIVYQFLRALMTFEIRERKARRRELERFFGPQRLEEYASEIEALRTRYWLLRIPLEEWVQSAARRADRRG